jgi:hypothetical protein
MKVFKKKDNTISILQDNWQLISDSFRIYKYSKGVLYLKTNMASIYVAHLHEEIRLKCNSFLGEDRIREVKFVK